MTNRLFFPEAEIDRILSRNRFVFHLRNGPPLPSFWEFLRVLDTLDENSRAEIFAFRRMAQIAFGRFQSCRLPSDHVALDRTWQMRYGLIDQFIADA